MRGVQSRGVAPQSPERREVVSFSCHGVFLRISCRCFVIARSREIAGARLVIRYELNV
jgi:hypothetical protein